MICFITSDMIHWLTAGELGTSRLWTYSWLRFRETGSNSAIIAYHLCVISDLMFYGVTQILLPIRNFSSTVLTQHC